MVKDLLEVIQESLNLNYLPSVQIVVDELIDKNFLRAVNSMEIDAYQLHHNLTGQEMDVEFLPCVKYLLEGKPDNVSNVDFLDALRIVTAPIVIMANPQMSYEDVSMEAESQLRSAVEQLELIQDYYYNKMLSAKGRLVDFELRYHKTLKIELGQFKDEQNATFLNAQEARAIMMSVIPPMRESTLLLPQPAEELRAAIRNSHPDYRPVDIGDSHEAAFMELMHYKMLVPEAPVDKNRAVTIALQSLRSQDISTAVMVMCLLNFSDNILFAGAM